MKGKRGFEVTINETKYRIVAVMSTEAKYPNQTDVLGLRLGLHVTRMHDNKVMDWEEMKGSYLAEKLIDYAENSINGQQTFYWKYEKVIPSEAIVSQKIKRVNNE